MRRVYTVPDPVPPELAALGCRPGDIVAYRPRVRRWALVRYIDAPRKLKARMADQYAAVRGYRKSADSEPRAYDLLVPNSDGPEHDAAYARYVSRLSEPVQRIRTRYARWLAAKGKICERCAARFYPRPSNAVAQRFCSAACRAQ